MEAAVPLSCFGWIASQNNPMRDKTRLKMNRKGYIGTMTQLPKGPVASEIEQRLQSALSPVHLAVINDSAKHSGQLGDDGSGESHFTVEIVAEAFVRSKERRVGQEAGRA